MPDPQINEKNVVSKAKEHWILPQGNGHISAHVLWMLLGCLAFLAGSIIQLMPERYPELSELLRQCENLPQSCHSAVLAFDLRGHQASSFTYATLFGDLLRSVGAAIVISILVTLTVEARSRKEFDSLLTAKIRELGLSVFHGMFNRNHPVALLDAVKQQILERDLIRDQLDVTYTLNEIEDGIGPDGQKECFIRVDVILSTSTSNVSTLRGPAGQSSMPLALILPNPQVPSLKQHVRVSRFVVNGAERSPEDLANANARLQEDLADDEKNDAVADFGTHLVEPGETVTLSATYTMIKELEDTEVFRTLQICRSLALTVIDRTGYDLHIQAKGMHPGKLRTISAANCTLQWRLEDIILPQQGIMVFWKRRRKG